MYQSTINFNNQEEQLLLETLYNSVLNVEQEDQSNRPDQSNKYWALGQLSIIVPLIFRRHDLERSDLYDSLENPDTPPMFKAADRLLLHALELLEDNDVNTMG